MTGISTTLVWDTLLSTTLNLMTKDDITDNISDGSPVLFSIKKAGNWKLQSEGLGAKAECAVLYSLAGAEAYTGLQALSTAAADCVTTAFYEWAQLAAPISISGLEMRQNLSNKAKLNLLKIRTKQALLSCQDFFNKKLLSGKGTSGHIDEAYTNSPATFVLPLPLLIAKDPTASKSIGEIPQDTKTWWQNQYKASAATTFAGFLKEIDNLITLCSMGPQGAPDLYLTDLSTYSLYKSALSGKVQLQSYAKADFPFANVMLNGDPLTPDPNVPDPDNGAPTVVYSSGKGTIYMINSSTLEVIVDSEHDFATGEFRSAPGVDGKTAQLLAYLAVVTNNRRKNGVLFSIDDTIVS